MRYRPSHCNPPDVAATLRRAETRTEAWSALEHPKRKGYETMKRALAGGLALLAVVVAGGAHRGAAQAPLRSPQAGKLDGHGGDVPVPADLEVDPRGRQGLGINITYSPTGSGAGIAAITARTVDFGASDAPLIASTSSTPARAAW